MSPLQLRTTSPATEDDHDAPAPPPEFLCPITLDLMQDPVAAPTGITYDRAAIESWLLLAGGRQRRRTCPVTHGELRAADLVPNHTLRRLIQDWLATNPSSSSAATSLPTPTEAAAVAELEAATRAGDAERCSAAARRVRRLASDEQSRLRLASAGCAAARALAAAFASFASAAAADDPAAAAADAALAALVLVMPMPDDAILAVGSSAAAVARLVAVAANGDLHRRLQAVVVIREILSLSASSHTHRSGTPIIIDMSADAEAAIAQVLVKTIGGGGGAVCPPATRRASLVAAYHLARAGERAAAALAAAGAVTALVELLVDADRCTAEKALAALDAALGSSRECRKRARADALAVPVLVRKMFCVSDAATQLVVSCLLRICKKCPGDEEEEGTAAAAAAVVEALQLGALQKVLLLLQAGCREETTKENATELLRLMVRYQGGSGECVDAMDLRGFKRDTAILTG